MSVLDDDSLPREKITLSERDWQSFTEALEEDREPTEAAKKAAARYNEGHRDGARYHWQLVPDQDAA